MPSGGQQVSLQADRPATAAGTPQRNWAQTRPKRSLSSRSPVLGVATIRELERGLWLENTVPDDFRHDVESLCHLLSTA